MYSSIKATSPQRPLLSPLNGKRSKIATKKPKEAKNTRPTNQGRRDPRSANTKQIKAAAVLNNAFATTGGDGKVLIATDHPLGGGGSLANRATTMADLNETSLEDALINISTFTDDRGLSIALRGMKLIVPPQLQFIADRLLQTPGRVGTSDNDINAVKNMGMLPDGYVVNHYLTDTDAFFIKTDCPDGFKHFERSPMSTALEGDFDTGNMRYKARERYSFGYSNFRAVYGSQGA